ncbi:hypothetical protein BDV06DRAFT_208189 [Aspergillus oleicola]
MSYHNIRLEHDLTHYTSLSISELGFFQCALEELEHRAWSHAEDFPNDYIAGLRRQIAMCITAAENQLEDESDIPAYAPFYMCGGNLGRLGREACHHGFPFPWLAWSSCFVLFDSSGTVRFFKSKYDGLSAMLYYYLRRHVEEY